VRCEETIAFEAYDVAVGAGESCCSFFSSFCVVRTEWMFLCAGICGSITGGINSIFLCSFVSRPTLGTGGSTIGGCYGTVMKSVNSILVLNYSCVSE